VKQSLGLLEVSGLALAIEVADAMAKSAAITLAGIEQTKGSGWMMIRITGDVAAVNSAVTTGAMLAERYHGLIARSVLARPDPQLVQCLVTETHGAQSSPTAPVPAAPAPDQIQEPVMQTEPESAAVAPILILPIRTDTAAIPVAAHVAAPDPIAVAAVKSQTATCNLCQDPACPRQKGEPRSKCIHTRDHA
jgi:microcompartment protein CcmL/EutN